MKVCDKCLKKFDDKKDIIKLFTGSGSVHNSSSSSHNNEYVAELCEDCYNKLKGFIFKESSKNIYNNDLASFNIKIYNMKITLKSYAAKCIYDIDYFGEEGSILYHDDLSSIISRISVTIKHYINRMDGIFLSIPNSIDNDIARYISCLIDEGKEPDPGNCLDIKVRIYNDHIHFELTNSVYPKESDLFIDNNKK